jgi:hypothetical protein
MIKILVSIISIFIFFPCAEKQNKPMEDKITSSKNDSIPLLNDENRLSKFNDTFIVNSFESAMTRHLARLNYFRHPDYLDSASMENNSVLKTVEKYKEAIFTIDKKNINGYFIAKSSDNNLCILSWDTQQGGTNIDFAAITIYKTLKEIKCKNLFERNIHTDEYVNFQMAYQNIQSVTDNKGQKIYLVNGMGQGSTALPWQDILAFQIGTNELTFHEVFPNYKYRIMVEFDLHEFENRDIPKITYENDNKTIKIPIANEKEGFDGNYRTLMFDGISFKE